MAYTSFVAKLDLLAAATTGKAYRRLRVSPDLARDVLEVGVGQAATPRQLYRVIVGIAKWLDPVQGCSEDKSVLVVQGEFSTRLPPDPRHPVKEIS